MATGLDRIDDRSPVAETPRRTKRVILSVNDQQHELELRVKTTLAEALREDLGLIGTKVGCNRAECGSCMVIVDGHAVFACTILAVEAGGKRIQTIEGLATSRGLHPIQDAFIRYDALQCGICIPGMVMSVKALLDQNSDPSEADVNEAIGGNLCRCGTYPNTVRAALAAARVMRGEEA